MPLPTFRRVNPAPSLADEADTVAASLAAFDQELLYLMAVIGERDLLRSDQRPSRWSRLLGY